MYRVKWKHSWGHIQIIWNLAASQYVITSSLCFIYKKRNVKSPHHVVLSCQLTLLVLWHVAPTVVVNKSITIYASKGSHPYLYCGVRYDKKVNVTYRWYFENARIEHDSRRRVNRIGQLTINGASERDDGQYRCDSSSSVGDYSTYVKLVVQG